MRCRERIGSGRPVTLGGAMSGLNTSKWRFSNGGYPKIIQKYPKMGKAVVWGTRILGNLQMDSKWHVFSIGKTEEKFLMIPA